MIKDYPKLESPFIREGKKAGYVCNGKINPEYKWVFESKECFAVDKIDGTNVSIIIKDGKIVRVFNRTNEKYVTPLKVMGASRWEGACLEGLSKACQRGWLKDMGDGQHFGELIGEIINGNRHKLAGHLWVPFEYLRNRCFWKSWSENKYPKDYESISNWFKDIPSLFNQKLGLEPIQAEGLVFYGKNEKGGWDKAKVRADMFDWFKGRRH